MILKYNLFKKSTLVNEKKFFLFYGPNFGKIESCVQTIKKRLISIDSSIKFLSFFQDDFQNQSFTEIVSQNTQEDIFGNKVSLIFSLSDLKISNEIIKVISSQNLNIQNIILKSGPIQKGLKIRSLLENSSDAIVVPCYEDSLAEKKDIITRFLNNEKIKINSHQTETLGSLLSNERLSLINELNKLVLYVKATKNDIINALSIITDNNSQDINNLVYSLASKKRENFWNEFFKLQQPFSDQIRFISIFSKHLEKILFVKNKILRGSTPINAMKSLKPPIFFKQEEAFLSQLNLWSYKNLTKIIKQLHSCQISFLKNEKSCKFSFLTLVTKILGQS
tara:strand:- start:168 stop:1175 length:1008 start_codon:yes stop_codon:yes gene_type:complete